MPAFPGEYIDQLKKVMLMEEDRLIAWVLDKKYCFIRRNNIVLIHMLGITADTINYSAQKFGVQVTGLGNAAISFAQKVAAGLGGALMGGVLELGGYDGKVTEQIASANTAIVACAIYIPLALTIACVAIMCFYDLDKKNAQRAAIQVTPAEAE